MIEFDLHFNPAFSSYFSDELGISKLLEALGFGLRNHVPSDPRYYKIASPTRASSLHQRWSLDPECLVVVCRVGFYDVEYLLFENFFGHDIPSSIIIFQEFNGFRHLFFYH